MESIEKLRKYVQKWKIYCYPPDIEAIADEIDREISERYMLLPVDADGVPIHVGDKLQYGDYSSGIVKALNERMVIAMHVDDDNLNYAKYGLLWDAEGCRHVKSRTIEDVLQCAGVSVAAIEDVAAEIRELMGVENEL